VTSKNRLDFVDDLYITLRLALQLLLWRRFALFECSDFRVIPGIWLGETQVYEIVDFSGWKIIITIFAAPF